MLFECNTLGGVSGYTSLSLFHGGSKPSPSCSFILAVKRLLTPSVCIGEPTLGADGRQTAEDRHHAESVSRIVCNSALSKMFLIYQLGLTTAVTKIRLFKKA